MPFAPSLPAGRAVLALDVLVAVWVAVWIAVGVAVNDTVQGLDKLTSGFGTVGSAIDTSGRVLGSLSVPFVGQPLAGAARQIQNAGQEVSATGASARDDIDAASDLLGLTSALVPILPILLLYAPPRVRRAREAGALRRMVTTGGDDPALMRLLAERAAGSASYARLARLSAAPWRDLEEGRYEALAGEELRRLGVRPPGRGGPEARSGPSAPA